MKVNISGVGLIPKVGLLAPVYGRELTKDTVAVILNYASFKVYVASTGARITKKNIDEIFGIAIKQAATPAPVAPAPKKKPAKKTAKVEKPVVVETPAHVAEVAETVVETVPEVLPEITEENIDEVKEAEPVVIESEEETPAEEDEEKPTYTSKKKKRR